MRNPKTASDVGPFSTLISLLTLGALALWPCSTTAQTRPLDKKAELNLSQGKVELQFTALSVDSPDYRSFEESPVGTVVALPGARCFKLKSDVDLLFGSTLVEAGNASPDYPGVYGLFLERRSNGWGLVINQQADVWGTMHNPEADVGRVPLHESSATEPATTLEMKLEATNTGGELRIFWGTRVLTTPFKTAS